MSEPAVINRASFDAEHIAWMREHVRCETCLWGYPNGCGHGLRASLKATWGCNTWEPREPTP